MTDPEDKMSLHAQYEAGQHRDARISKLEELWLRIQPIVEKYENSIWRTAAVIVFIRQLLRIF